MKQILFCYYSPSHVVLVEANGGGARILFPSWCKGASAKFLAAWCIKANALVFSQFLCFVLKFE